MPKNNKRSARKNLPSRAAAPSPATEPAKSPLGIPPDHELPGWDDDNDVLSFRGVPVLVLSREATNLRALLNAFQRAGWPRRIATLLLTDYNRDPHQQLADAVHTLNGKQTPLRIRFSRDGRGTGLCWKAVAEKL